MISLALALSASAPPLTLDAAVEIALQRSARPRLQDLKVVEAEAHRGAQVSAFLPEISANGEYLRQPYATSFAGSNLQRLDKFGAGASASQPVLNVPAIFSVRQAQHELDAAHDRRDQARLLLSRDVALQFLVTVRAEALQEASAQTLQLAREQATIAEQRLQARLVDADDVAQAQLRLATAARLFATYQRETETAYLDLGRLMVASEPLPRVQVPEDLLDRARRNQRNTPVQELVDRAEERRADVAAAKALEQAAGDAAASYTWSILPTVHLVARADISDQATFVGGRNYDGALGARLNWNIFDRGLHLWRQAEQESRQGQSALELQGLIRDVEVQVRRAHNDVRRTNEAEGHARDAVRAAEQHAETMHARYKLGLAEALHVFVADERLFDAKKQLATAQFDLARAYVELRTALGSAPHRAEDL